MNKKLKAIIAVLGGCDLIFGITIPIFISLLIINTVQLTQFNSVIILIIGLLSTMFRAIKVWIK